MKSNESRWSLLASLAALVFYVYPSHVHGNTELHYGDPVRMGNGTVRTYLALDSAGAPTELGLLMNDDSLHGLPAERSTAGRCFDMNGNGRIDAVGECEGDHEYVLTLPSVVEDRWDIPIQWVGVNWNVEGHAPPGVYDLPHFDFHFYIADEAAVRGIRAGRCAFFIDCGDFGRAIQPVPSKYVDHRHVNVDAAVAAMGNHLIDSTSHEFAKPPGRFTHTWIFGAYDGRITFYEPMITHAFLMTRPNICVPIKQPHAWQVSGYYPSRYCIRHHARAKKYTVSLEGLEYRKAE